MLTNQKRELEVSIYQWNCMFPWDNKRFHETDFNKSFETTFEVFNFFFRFVMFFSRFVFEDKNPFTGHGSPNISDIFTCPLPYS